MALAAEEMTRHQEVTEEVQKPCSEILVNLCRSVKVHDVRRATYLEKVMDVMIEKFDGGGAHGGHGGHGGANGGSTDSPVSARKNHSHDNPVPPHYYVIQVWSQTGRRGQGEAWAYPLPGTMKTSVFSTNVQSRFA